MKTPGSPVGRRWADLNTGQQLMVWRLQARHAVYLDAQKVVRLERRRRPEIITAESPQNTP